MIYFPVTVNSTLTLVNAERVAWMQQRNSSMGGTCIWFSAAEDDFITCTEDLKEILQAIKHTRRVENA